MLAMSLMCMLVVHSPEYFSRPAETPAVWLARAGVTAKSLVVGGVPSGQMATVIGAAVGTGGECDAYCGAVAQASESRSKLSAALRALRRRPGNATARYDIQSATESHLLAVAAFHQRRGELAARQASELAPGTWTAAHEIAETTKRGMPDAVAAAVTADTRCEVSRAILRERRALRLGRPVPQAVQWLLSDVTNSQAYSDARARLAESGTAAERAALAPVTPETESP